MLLLIGDAVHLDLPDQHLRPCHVLTSVKGKHRGVQEQNVCTNSLILQIDQ